MNGMFRQSMTWLHTWTGLVFCWLLYFMFVTGTLGYFDTEIDQWMKPEFGASAPADFSSSLAAGQQRLAETAPAADNWFINPANGREYPHLRVFWNKVPEGGGDREFGDEFLSMPHGSPIEEVRETGGGQVLYRMHYLLHYFPGQMGYYIMAIATMLMFIGIMTGIVAHKKIFADFFTFRWAKGQRSWLDMHNLLAVSTLPFQLMITYSGLIFTVVLWMPFVALGTYGFDIKALSNIQTEIFDQEVVERSGTSAPLVDVGSVAQQGIDKWGEGNVRGVQVQFPNDQNARIVLQRKADFGPISDTMTFDGTTGELLSETQGYPNAALGFAGTLIGLHEGLFAGPLLRWLYFLMGTLGIAMIATGAIYWCVKRKPKTYASDVGFGYRFVEHLNVGTIAGLLIAVVVYFWANRLLAIDLVDRADWEVHCMFLGWLACFVHALIRPLDRAWVEQCWALAALCFGLPIVNFLTTDIHLMNTLSQGNWVLASFDLVAIAVGLAAVYAGRLLSRKLVPNDTVGVEAVYEESPASAG
ncbi:MAG: PepSY-associated TM helix domain-containing protein [Pseudomonadota bacterium]